MSTSSPRKQKRSRSEVTISLRRSLEESTKSPPEKRRRVKGEYGGGSDEPSYNEYFLLKYAEWFLFETGDSKRFLRGPNSVFVFPNVRNRGFILFGDEHTPLRRETCFVRTEGGEEIKSEKINLALERIFKEKLEGGGMHDFFFEHRYLKTDPENFEEEIHWAGEKYKDAPIYSVSEKFATCFRVDKKACKDIFPSVRFHYVDYRFGYTISPVTKEKVKSESFLSSISSKHDFVVRGIAGSNDVLMDYNDYLKFTTRLAFGGGILRKFLSEFYNSEIHKKPTSFKRYISGFIKRVKETSPEGDEGHFLFEERFSNIDYFGNGEKGRCYCIEEFFTPYRSKMIKSIFSSSPVAQEIISFVEREIAEPLIQEYEKIVDDGGVFELAKRIAKSAQTTSFNGKTKRTVRIQKNDYETLITNLKSSEVALSLLYLSAIYEFDIPTACRMFKPSLVYQGSRFVWLYSGAKHTENIAKIISHLASKTVGDWVEPLVDYEPGNDRKCIKMPYNTK